MTEAQIYLLIGAGILCIIIAQLILSSIESRWFGWLLPLMSLVASSTALIVKHGATVYYSWLDVAKTVGLFLLYNCGTVVLILIYIFCRKGRHNRMKKRTQRENERQQRREQRDKERARERQNAEAARELPPAAAQDVTAASPTEKETAEANESKGFLGGLFKKKQG